jgi:hypothetical protein
MFEARVKHFRYNESLMARLIAFLRKEATEKEAAKKEMVEKEDNDDEEDQQVWPSGCSNDDGPISPIRFPRVKRWFKCPICLNHLYQHKKSLFVHIKKIIKDELSTLDVVEQHHQLNRLLEATMCDP